MRPDTWSRWCGAVRPWAALPLRLFVGYGFIAHGLAKLARGPDVFAATLQRLDVPSPHIMSWATILVELFGGCAVLFGAFIPLVFLPMTAVLLVAIVKVHWAYGFSSIKLAAVTAAGPQFGPPGIEVAVSYVAALTALLVGGAGPWSVERYLARRRE